MYCNPRWTTLLFITAMPLVLLALLAAGRHDALADDYTCPGTVGQMTLDNVYVPQGATCTLN